MNPGPVALTVALADRYRVERELGAGGMATVYLAHDIKHERDVAIKVLHQDLAAALGAERFLAEIKTTAKLQHPHILPLLDSGEAGGLLYYVMPFVAGESLRDRLNREKQLPIDDAVRIAREVADALAYAHGHGVIHRDIKPENILLQERHALVADFGIALAVSAAGGVRMTQTGLSLGTPQYMSPEQAMGEKAIDARTDIYALGAVTYEMLTGEPPFTGATVQAVVAKVISADPERPTLMRKTIPPHIEDAVLAALAKVPADRCATATEFAAALTGASTRARPGVRSTMRPRFNARALPAAVALALIVGAALGLMWASSRSERNATPQVLPLALDRRRAPHAITATLAPSGEFIIYSGMTSRSRFDFASGTAVDIPATNGLALTISPGSDSVAVRSSGWMGQVWVVSLATAERRMVADSALNYEMSWSDDGWIYFGRIKGGVDRVRPDGSHRENVIAYERGSGSRLAGGIEALPEGRGLLFARGDWSNVGAEPEVVVYDAKRGTQTAIAKGVQARYLSTGHLAIVQADGSVRAAPFSLRSLRPSGAFVHVLDSVEVYGGFQQRAALTVSNAGDMLYLRSAPIVEDSVLLIRRDGRVAARVGGFGGWISSDIVLVPADGKRLIASVNRETGGAPNIWQIAADSGAPLRLSRGQILDYVQRLLHGEQLVTFVSPRAGDNWDLYRTPVSGTTDATRILDREGDITTVEFSRDESWVAFCEGNSAGQIDLFAHRFGQDSASVTIAATPATECSPSLSPDGRWVAYSSDELKRNEIYIQPFPVASNKRWQLTTQGASGPRWSRDGREIFYRSADGQMMAVPVQVGVTVTWSQPVALFSMRGLVWTGGKTADDRLFAMIKRDLRAPGQPILVKNWTAYVAETVANRRSQ